MVTWTWRDSPRSRRCDVPDCPNDSVPEHSLVIRPVIGPALDLPLRLFFCEQHGDPATLFDRYRVTAQ